MDWLTKHFVPPQHVQQAENGNGERAAVQSRMLQQLWHTNESSTLNPFLKFAAGCSITQSPTDVLSFDLQRHRGIHAPLAL